MIYDVAISFSFSFTLSDRPSAAALHTFRMYTMRMGGKGYDGDKYDYVILIDCDLVMLH